MYDDGKALLFLNGVNTGRMEILKQIEDILNTEEFPEYVDWRIRELFEKYKKDGVI